ncbi:unnamed protein product [uncultured virus]|nr:unnamed protein product [uncultured virus]
MGCCWSQCDEPILPKTDAERLSYVIPAQFDVDASQDLEALASSSQVSAS